MACKEEVYNKIKDILIQFNLVNGFTLDSEDNKIFGFIKKVNSAIYNTYSSIFDIERDYVPGDIRLKDGKLYICIQDSTGNEITDINYFKEYKIDEYSEENKLKIGYFTSNEEITENKLLKIEKFDLFYQERYNFISVSKNDLIKDSLLVNNVYDRTKDEIVISSKSGTPTTYYKKFYVGSGENKIIIGDR